MKTQPKSKLSNYLKSYLIIILIGIFSYSNSLHSPFQFDGVIYIQKNDSLKSLDAFFKKHDVTNYSNRFVSGLTLTFNFWLGNLDTFGFHLLNLLIHLSVCVLIFVVTGTLSKSFRNKDQLLKNNFNLPLLAAILFSAHPVFTQTVSYLVNRSALLSTFFYLFSFYSFICALQAYFSKPKTPFRRLKYLVLFTLSLGLMVLGIGSKLTAISLPLVMTTYYIAIQYRANEGAFSIIRREKKLLLIFLTPLIAILIQRAFFTKRGLFHIADEGSFTINRLDYVLSQIKWLSFYYFKLIALPFNQNIDPDMKLIESILDPKLLIGILFLGAVLYVSRNFQKMAIFGIAWFIIALSPESSFIPLVDIVTEHRLYLPCIGLAIALCAISIQRRAFTILIFLIPIFVINTINRNSDWVSEYALWSDSVRKSPEKARPHLNMARALSLMGQNKEAIPHYQKTIKLRPRYFEAYHNLGVSFSMIGECKNSLEPFENALMLHPKQIETVLSLANCHKTLKNYEKSAMYLQKAIRLKPNKDYIARELGTIYYFNLDEKEKGRLFFLIWGNSAPVFLRVNLLRAKLKLSEQLG